jgi:hypothetical protein
MTAVPPLIVENGTIRQLPSTVALLAPVAEPLTISGTQELVFDTDGEIVMGLVVYPAPYNFRG